MLGDKIKELRKSKNMYQQDLADALSVSKSTVAMWETNKRIPDTTMLVKIADYFDITVDYLLEEERRILAIQKHGFCYDNEEREKIKADSRNKISSGTLSDEDLINEAISAHAETTETAPATAEKQDEKKPQSIVTEYSTATIAIR